MTINTEMFQKIYDQITQHPDTHDQGTFEDCGTSRCIAGWAVALRYGVADTTIYSGEVPDREDEEVEGVGYLSGTAVIARNILGLTGEQAYDLFYDLNDERAVEKCLRYATKGDEA